MEITKELLENILDAYSYEIVFFVERQHIVSYMNKIAKERYGNRAQKELILVKMKYLKRVIQKQAKENSLCLFVIIINKLLVILKDMKYHGTKIIQQSL